MQVHGYHHVTAVTGEVRANRDFYTRVLGLRLVKKSVNQDDTSAYHMFYADKLGTVGTDMTFFDWPHTAPNVRGGDSIALTMFRVSGRAALEYWQARLASLGVAHGGLETLAGRDALRFEDPEGQRLALVDDQGAPYAGEIWERAGIPLECATRGFFGVRLAVPGLARMAPIFDDLMGFENLGDEPAGTAGGERLRRYAMDGGGPGRELHLVDSQGLRPAALGRGGVHHVAFRVRDEAEQRAWLKRLADYGVPNSGVVERYYFKSVYFRISNGILFELATDGPGFGVDEPLATLGERLALPPFLEPQRAQIEAQLKPI